MFPGFRCVFISSINYSSKSRWNVASKTLRFLSVFVERSGSTVPQEIANYVSENTFARNIIESMPQYKDLVVLGRHRRCLETNSSVEAVLESTNFLDMPVNDFCDLFEKLSGSTSIPIMDLSCNNLRIALKEHCKKFTDEQLSIVLRCLACWPLQFPSKSSFYYGLCIEFDNICISQWKKWNLKKVFHFMDLWYGLQIAKYSNFFFKASTRLAHNPHKLSPEQVVLLLFYLNLLRTATKHARMFELEYRLSKVASELSIDELGVAVMGFFKADKALFNVNLMEHLIDQVISEIKTVPDITFTSIMKALRKSVPTSVWPKLGSLCDAISEEIPRFSIQSSIHAALVLTKPQFLHKPLLNSVSQKVVQSVSKCRLKDMEKAMFPLVQLVYNPHTDPCIFNTILEELGKPERSEEIKEYPKSFIALIHYFCLKGIYPEKFIQEILDMEFITTVYGKQKFNYGREVLCIDTAVELDFPSYKGPRLPVEIRNYLSKRYSEYLPDPTRKLSRHQTLHLDIIQTAEILFGKECMAVKYLLPSQPKADIVVHLDENMKPSLLSDSLKNAEDFNGPLKAPDKNYYALIVGSKNLYLYKSKKINGETTFKVKQLKLLGYTPLIVLSEEWPTSSTFEKVEHLKKLISSAGDEENHEASY